MATLTYSIFEGELTGHVAGKRVHISALSGGGGGAWAGASMPGIVNWPYATHQRRSGSQRGGAIPPGVYTIGRPFLTGIHYRAKLMPHGSLPNDRGGFQIHGRGEHGSDGCIVPLFSSEHGEYWKAYDKFMADLAKDGGGTLVVIEAQGGDLFA